MKRNSYPPSFVFTTSLKNYYFGPQAAKYEPHFSNPWTNQSTQKNKLLKLDFHPFLKLGVKRAEKCIAIVGEYVEK